MKTVTVTPGSRHKSKGTTMNGREVVLKGAGLKHDQEKAQWDLLPWKEMSSVVDVLTFGAKKYKPNNWRKVEQGERRYTAAALRHLSAIGSGEQTDKETGFSHYAHAICSLLFAFWHSRQERRKRANDDGPNYEE